MKDLITTQGRIEALRQLNAECHNEFLRQGIELSPNALFDVKRHLIEISIKETDGGSSYFGYSAFASEITLCSNKNRGIFADKDDEVTIKFGSSGEFTPNSQSSYWRTIHAASVLKNWEIVSQLVDEYCTKAIELDKEIHEANK